MKAEKNPSHFDFNFRKKLGQRILKRIKCRVEIMRGLGLGKNKFHLDFNLKRFKEKSILTLGLKCGPKFS